MSVESSAGMPHATKGQPEVKRIEHGPVFGASHEAKTPVITNAAQVRAELYREWFRKEGNI